MATRICPYCKEKIKRDAIICKYCHKELEPLPPEPKPRPINNIFLAFMAMGAGAALVLLWGYYKEWKRWRDDNSHTDYL